jgi:hypothetical protein
MSTRFAVRAVRYVQGMGIGAILAMAASVAAAQDSDRHAGYYYPPATVTETFEATAPTMAGLTRLRRVNFATIIANKALAGSYPPTHILFVKGAEAEKLIIIGMGNYVANIYQARALLAQLTAQARTTEMFLNLDPEYKLTFLDLLKMLGFQQLTVSDGLTFTLQIAIK